MVFWRNLAVPWEDSAGWCDVAFMNCKRNLLLVVFLRAGREEMSSVGRLLNWSCFIRLLLIPRVAKFSLRSSPCSSWLPTRNRHCYKSSISSPKKNLLALFFFLLLLCNWQWKIPAVPINLAKLKWVDLHSYKYALVSALSMECSFFLSLFPSLLLQYLWKLTETLSQNFKAKRYNLLGT